YWAMLIVLMALIFRPVAFDFRSKVAHTAWRTSWDWMLFAGSAIPPVIFGVAFGNLLLGVPFYIDESMRPIYTGSFWALLNPFGLLCGVLSLSMIIFHGANYLVLRTEGHLQTRSRTISTVFGLLSALLFAAGGIWTY
ncbi:Cytochrome bd ubiquinol oxidase, subunit II, partial [gut metagenome]